MSEAVSHLGNLIDALPEPDKRWTAEVLRRCPLGEGDMASSELDALAVELFSALDAEETAWATDR